MQSIDLKKVLQTVYISTYYTTPCLIVYITNKRVLNLFLVCKHYVFTKDRA